jgi:hypothetical protein
MDFTKPLTDTSGGDHSKITLRNANWCRRFSLNLSAHLKFFTLDEAVHRTGDELKGVYGLGTETHYSAAGEH